MANIVNCQLLSKAFGAQQLFKNINLVINEGDRIGLIGPNGSGKSTLLRILCELEDLDSGTILKQKHARLTYLPQVDRFDEAKNVVENLAMPLDELPIDDTEKHNRVHSLLSRAEFPDPSVGVASLSGGWRKRLSICRSLVVHPDVLVMDEPTNHLDIEGILWLENMLSASLPESPAAYLIVSHDRRFLENSVTRIVELSAAYPEGSFQVEGRYSQFLVAKETFLQQQEEQETRLSNQVRRETEWLRRGPKARSTKARYRIDEAHKLQDTLAQVKARNRASTSVQIDFEATGRKTKKLLVAEKLTKGYEGKTLFENLDMTLSPGTRLGLLGRNGCGKSTLMQLLAAGNSERPHQMDGGTLRVAENVQIVSFDQKREQLDTSLTLRRALAPEGDSIVCGDRSIHVISWAKRFLFQPDQLETPVEQLSGGEQARILIAALMRQPADILLLDEPTNDLDIPSLHVLEESLMDFPGALVLVTHDRFLLDRVCDSMLGFDGQGGVDYFADYEQWLRALKKVQKQTGQHKAKSKPAASKGTAKKSTAGKLSYMDQREYDQMEEKIMEAEAEQEELEQQMKEPETVSDPALLQQCWARLEEVQHGVEALYQRWDELEEKKKTV